MSDAMEYAIKRGQVGDFTTLSSYLGVDGQQLIDLIEEQIKAERICGVNNVENLQRLKERATEVQKKPALRLVTECDF